MARACTMGVRRKMGATAIPVDVLQEKEESTPKIRWKANIRAGDLDDTQDQKFWKFGTAAGVNLNVYGGDDENGNGNDDSYHQ